MEISCNGCDETWTGLTRCHCGSCHITCATVEAWEAHRRGRNCVTPMEAGLVLDENEYWCVDE